MSLRNDSVDTYERAQQFWSVLAFAAREQKVVSYEMLSQLTGMAQECGRELGHIYYYCVDQKLPLLNLLAVSKESGKPGHGCPTSVADLPSQQARVFIYDWFEHGAPSADDFRRAAAKAAIAETVKT
jgi:hypothetical protein